jgi:hypothetical protein
VGCHACSAGCLVSEKSKIREAERAHGGGEFRLPELTECVAGKVLEVRGHHFAPIAPRAREKCDSCSGIEQGRNGSAGRNRFIIRVSMDEKHTLNAHGHNLLMRNVHILVPSVFIEPPYSISPSATGRRDSHQLQKSYEPGFVYVTV